MPTQVNKVAERLDNILATYNQKAYPQTGFILEMKSDTGSSEKMAKVLYGVLKKFDRFDIIVSSIDPNRLKAMQKLAAQDGKTLKLMLVKPVPYELTKSDVDKLRNEMPYVKYIAFNTDLVPGNTTKKSVVDYAKNNDLYVAGWNWDPTNNIRGCPESKKRAKELDLDIDITDCIRP